MELQTAQYTAVVEQNKQLQRISASAEHVLRSETTLSRAADNPREQRLKLLETLLKLLPASIKNYYLPLAEEQINGKI